MDRSDRSDRDTRSLVSRRELLRDRYARDRESGQATVEFALILVPLLIIVAGIIYFGIGLNYWLDMNKVANQGARWAAVNNWPPQCDRTQTSCTSSTSCDELQHRQQRRLTGNASGHTPLSDTEQRDNDCLLPGYRQESVNRRTR